ncbi:HTH-type transcriptional activator RhaS [compost metagenome]
MHYAETIALDDLSALSGLSKFYLIRQFSKQKGISPYSYLETIRVDKAKKLLEQGVGPMEAAMLTGFSDQSHFSNFFKKLIGLTPKQYMNVFSDRR